MITLNEEAGTMNTAAPQMALSPQVEGAMQSVDAARNSVRNILEMAASKGDLAPTAYEPICTAINTLLKTVRDALIVNYTDYYDERATLHYLAEALQKTIESGQVSWLSIDGIVRYQQWHAARLRTEVTYAYIPPVQFVPLADIKLPKAPMPESAKSATFKDEAEARKAFNDLIRNCHVLQSVKIQNGGVIQTLQVGVMGMGPNKTSPDAMPKSCMQLRLMTNHEQFGDIQEFQLYFSQWGDVYKNIYSTSILKVDLTTAITELFDIVTWWSEDPFDFIQRFTIGAHPTRTQSAENGDTNG